MLAKSVNVNMMLVALLPRSGSFNRSLQVTFDPPPTFAVAKVGVASNAPELRRLITRSHYLHNILYMLHLHSILYILR